MNEDEIKYCPGTLSEGFATYSSSCLKALFNGKKVSHRLMFDEPKADDSIRLVHNTALRVQNYIDIKQKKNKLVATPDGENGTHFIKTSLVDVKNADDALANEHLTMQIALQVYGINVAPNAMIWFKDNKRAYISKRFDVKSDGSALKTINFNSISESDSFLSFEEIASLIRQNVPAWRVEIEKFYSTIIFHSIFSNGGCNVNLFSLVESQLGDLILSPAYNLINTAYHLPADPNPVRGLFIDGFQSEESQQSGKIHQNDLVEFGRRIGVTEKRIQKLLYPFTQIHPKIEVLISNSYISNSLKRNYLLDYNTKINYFNMQLSTIEQIAKPTSAPNSLLIPFDDL
jgi:serine/threonine-protein kinase HipA